MTLFVISALFAVVFIQTAHAQCEIELPAVAAMSDGEDMPSDIKIITNATETAVIGADSSENLVLQFDNVAVPKRARIDSASMSIAVWKSTDSEHTNTIPGVSLDLIFGVIDTDDCDVSVLTNVVTSGSSVEWKTSQVPITEDDSVYYTTTDLSDIVQEAINRNDWSGSSSLCVVASPEDTTNGNTVETRLEGLTLSVAYSRAFSNECDSSIGLSETFFMWSLTTVSSSPWYKRYTVRKDSESAWFIKTKLETIGQSQSFLGWYQEYLPSLTALQYRTKSRLSWTSSGYVTDITDVYNEKPAIWMLTVSSNSNLMVAYVSFGSSSEFNSVMFGVSDTTKILSQIDNKLLMTASGGIQRTTTFAPEFFINNIDTDTNNEENLPGECLFAGDTDSCPAFAECAVDDEGLTLECVCIAEYMLSVRSETCVPQELLLPTAITRRWAMENNVAQLSGIPEQYLEGFVNSTFDSAISDDLEGCVADFRTSGYSGAGGYTTEGFFGWNNTCSGEFIYSLRSAEPTVDTFQFQASNKYGLSNLATVTIDFETTYERDPGCVLVITIFTTGLFIVFYGLIRHAALQALLASYRTFGFCESSEDDEEETGLNEEQPAYSNPIADIGKDKDAVQV